MITYPGLPAPVIEEHLTRDASRSHYAEGTTFSIGSIRLVGNTGTYLDTPFHRFEDGGDLADLPLERVADLQAVVVRPDLTAGRAIGPEASPAWPSRVVRCSSRPTGIATGGPTQYGTGHPFLTEAAARALVDGGASLVGIDTLNIDDTADGRRPAHTALLGAAIPIVEHMTGLAALPAAGFASSRSR